MRTLWILILALTTASSAIAGNDVFQKWRTPAGTLYIGDRPPGGSVLLERIELASREETAPTVTGMQPSPNVLAEAARDGREIMRLRAAEREARRDRDLERDLRERVVRPVETTAPVVVFGGGGRFHHGRRHGHGHRHRLSFGIGPSPLSTAVRPDIRLVTPDFSAMAPAPLFPAPATHRDHR